MTDFKNIIEITFPDDGVSVLYYMCHCVIVFSFFFFFSGCESTVRRWQKLALPICYRFQKFRRKKVSWIFT